MSGKQIKEIIIAYLTERGNYSMSDDILIDEIVFNMNLMKQCKNDIKEEGYKLNITQNPDKEPYWTKNQSTIIYFMALKEIKTLFQTMGITPRERIKLQLEMKEANIDEFDEVFG